MESQIEIYKTADDDTEITVKFQEETVWLNRNQLSELFDRDVKTIGKHVNNIFREGELEKDSVVAKFATTAKGKGVKTSLDSVFSSSHNGFKTSF